MECVALLVEVMAFCQSDMSLMASTFSYVTGCSSDGVFPTYVAVDALITDHCECRGTFSPSEEIFSLQFNNLK